MSNKAKRKEIVQLPVASLKPHALQEEIYGGRAEWQIEELADDMGKRGQDEDVEVTPDHTVIAGHGRVAAAKRLGWTTIRCWVRHDLAEAGPQAVEARLIEANLYRRQLSRLDMVRSYRYLKRVARGSKGKLASTDRVKGDLRDLIAKRFDVSGRTLDRWLQVLDLPMPLQKAVDDGRLPLTQAVKITGLRAQEQAQVADRVQAGEDPTAVVKDFVPLGTGRHTSVNNALASLHRSLMRGINDLDGRVEFVAPREVDEIRSDLERARGVIDHLLAMGNGQTPSCLDRDGEEE